ncbi:alpha/beta hydrolase [Burkholderia multivorans]|uniref:Bacteriophage-encoded membrane protein n=2 Tax=root TaxID=1 RepID=A0A0H3KPM4_BURM1|nr:alpha/beta hydrolase [Burkholderia multivorans]YP_004306378.1 membrane protein [Burkholderia phage KS5]ABX18536.1 putative phage-encoded membrane protein [Burkholderia multivorans ATCC 17616]ADP02259.1 gp12 [Burkholderia phage KS5]MBU9463608.1 alpha/beta hydrolase [Burkholderia multivorans]MBU9512175.1 alpha/beta hydrolase [Burkholderia multivorans]MCA8481593.1 alpha/beta hydrolase [Burkholderia multivorans]
MNQKFDGEIGQVAGGDVKSNSAQTSVNVHFHGGEPKAAETEFINNKQRAAIAHRVFKIQKQTGTEALMVYRRLKTVFDYESIERMPRSKYKPAISYLDSWLRNGNLGNPPGSAALQKVKHPSPAAPTARRESPSPHVQFASPAAATFSPAAPMATAVPVQQNSRASRRGAMALVGIAVIVAAATVYLYVERHPAGVRQQVEAAEPPQCEYGGNRYSLGGVVMQAGIRQRCVADADHGVRWERATGGRR